MHSRGCSVDTTYDVYKIHGQVPASRMVGVGPTAMGFGMRRERESLLHSTRTEEGSQ